MSEKIMSAIIEEGKKLEPYFFIPDHLKDFYLNLVLYFTESKKCIWNLKKGLLLCGDIGVGKTLSMTIMQNMFHKHSMISTRYIVRDFLTATKPGYILDKYGRESFHRTPNNLPDMKRPIVRCFDDLGLEELNAKFYGNNQNVIEEILVDRYDKFLSHGLKTHATSNATPEIIEEAYGKRLRNRIKQMMNYIPLTGESLRK